MSYIFIVLDSPKLEADKMQLQTHRAMIQSSLIIYLMDPLNFLIENMISATNVSIDDESIDNMMYSYRMEIAQ